MTFAGKRLLTIVTLGLTAMLGVMAPTANAQQASAPAPSAAFAEAGPCDNIGTKTTVRQCWTCFNALLDECSGNSTTPERREACFNGANTFFEFCLDRVPGAHEPRDVEELILEFSDGRISEREFNEILSNMLNE